MKYFHSEQLPIEIVLSEHIDKDFSVHNHANHYITSLCTKGSVAVTLEHQTLHLREHDFFIVPPLMPHAVQLTDTSALLSLCIGKSFLEKYCLTESRIFLSSLLSSPDSRRQITGQQTERLLATLPAIYKQHLTQNNMEKEMAALCDRLMHHSLDCLPLDRLASDLFMSKYHLIRKCKKQLGLTPHKFHIQNQIRTAQKLLLTGKSITETSAAMGFYDQSHFDRTFKKIVGISPTEYLRSAMAIS